MVKVAGLKARNSIKKRLRHRYFPVNFTHLFLKNLFTEHFWMTAFADSLAPTKFFITLLSSHFFSLFLHVFPFITDIVGKEIPAPLFKAHTSLPSLPPFLKSLFALPSFLSHLLLRYFRQFPHP